MVAMAASPVPGKMTVEEYLEFERASEEKHEYYGGELVAMAGARNNHVRIVMSLSIALGRRLEGTPCEPRGNDQRVGLATGETFVYPDLTINCGEPTFREGEFDTLTNPKVVFEVLSESTEHRDRGIKARIYWSIPSVEAYVLVSQTEPRVELFTRIGPGEYRLREFVGLEATLPLESVGIEVPLGEIYARVDFDEPVTEP